MKFGVTVGPTEGTGGDYSRGFLCRLDPKPIGRCATAAWHAERLESLTSQFAHGSAYQIADAYAWRGDADLAFEWLERAYVQRDGGTSPVNYDPLLKPLRGDPRFATLRQKLRPSDRPARHRFSRTLGAGTDIGAYERQPGATDDVVFFGEFDSRCD